MNCSGCGRLTTSDQKFCRSCGAGLQHASRPFDEPTRTSGSASVPTIVRDTEYFVTNRMVRWGFVVMFVGLSMGVIGKILVHVDALTAAGVLFAFAGMFFCTYPFLKPSNQRKHIAEPRSQPQFSARAEPTNKLPQMSDLDFVPTSVTEGTTELLKSAKKTSRST